MKVSVVVPCYDSSEFVAETAASVFAQTFTNLELIFVDDGSRDHTCAVIERVIARHPGRRACLIRRENGGVAAARNTGVAAATGEYILPLDADDLIAPSLLDRCVALLEADSALALAYTDRRDFGAVERVWPAGRFELERLKYFNQLSYCALFRRSLWEQIGGYRTNVSGFDDWDFWLAAAARGARAGHVAEPLLQHRRRPGSQLATILPMSERLHAQIALNNAGAYSADELDAAQRFLDTGERAPFLRASRMLFLAHFVAVPEQVAT